MFDVVGGVFPDGAEGPAETLAAGFIYPRLSCWRLRVSTSRQAGDGVPPFAAGNPIAGPQPHAFPSTHRRAGTTSSADPGRNGERMSAASRASQSVVSSNARSMGILRLRRNRAGSGSNGCSQVTANGSWTRVVSTIGTARTSSPCRSLACWAGRCGSPARRTRLQAQKRMPRVRGTAESPPA